jgi:hypothetical protein
MEWPDILLRDGVVLVALCDGHHHLDHRDVSAHAGNTRTGNSGGRISASGHGADMESALRSFTDWFSRG